MSKHSALRLFVALYPPLDAARQMAVSCAAIDLPNHRLTREDQIHLTLFFVGDTDPRQLENVLESVQRSASGIGTITLTPSRLITLPEQDAPRLLALETDAPANLLELQRRLSRRLSRRSHRGSETFLPHLTLCRYEKPGGDPIRAPVVMPSFELASVAVVESVLKPAGAEHRVLERVPLE